ncbi:MAG TPA: twin-arginine translocase TatA/TatE family subunit [Chloroflexota bacterium]|jgi:sec-independent protein translocase protein TatA|nr:twin-arginine translocase TatA/TatE family subunit [Chloroflexota bacterium]
MGAAFSPVLLMFPQLGPMELVVILVIALMIFGAGKLPEVGSALGRSIKEFKKATADEPPAIPPSDSAPAPSTTIPAPPAAAAGQIYCAKCGAQATTDSRFCAKCGSALPTAVA